MKKLIFLVGYIAIALFVMVAMVNARAKMQPLLVSFFVEYANAYTREAERNANDMTDSGLVFCILVLIERVIYCYLRVAHPTIRYVALKFENTKVYACLALIGVLVVEVLYFGAKIDEIAGWQAFGATLTCVYLFPAFAWLLHFTLTAPISALLPKKPCKYIGVLV